MSYNFGSASFRTADEMLDAIALQWVGAGGEPTLETIDDVLRDFDASAEEAEVNWQLTSEHDERVKDGERDAENGGLEGYDRAEFKAAILRLRERLSIEEGETVRWVLTANYRGVEYEGVGIEDDQPSAHTAAWHNIAAALPDGEPGDVVDLDDAGCDGGKLVYDRELGWTFG